MEFTKNMYYIGTLEQVTEYNDQVTKAEVYAGTTTQWSEPRPHPTESDIWVVAAHPKYPSSELESVDALPSSPPEEI